MARAIDVLRANQSTNKSQWREQAKWYTDNWYWLRHSLWIAIQTRRQMTDLGLTQKELAERIGCSQQYVSLILKGKENLTLETISKLERALDFNVFPDPNHYVEGYTPNYKPTFLSEPEGPGYGEK